MLVHGADRRERVREFSCWRHPQVDLQSPCSGYAKEFLAFIPRLRRSSLSFHSTAGEAEVDSQGSQDQIFRC